jgi:hypothetical protein
MPAVALSVPPPVDNVLLVITVEKPPGIGAPGGTVGP